ncbi:MAG: hypothetical protein L6Q54_02375 [Leptospiraceae bacterium]|nr:hypothetical protein [Leptospiraceae bacterium]MCK6380085.1 hypothetical protein [Leptospiraceae bacterium]NUM40474.1 hypothetical protein [Leptospiraceae bacterium]
MFKKISGFIIVLLLQNHLFSADVDQSGNFKIKPYSQKQESDLTILSKDIDDFHKKISELLPFMEKEKKIKDGKYIKQLSAYRDSFPLRTADQFMVNEQFMISLGGRTVDGKGFVLENITFSRRVSRLGKLKDELKSLYEIANTSASKSGYEGIELRLTNTNATGTAPVKIYNLKNIVDPRERVRLVRHYRNNLELALRQMDKVIQNNFRFEEIETERTMRELH